ncbi:polysaccharide pyruvyl transferase family protein [Photobacterium damselae]
MWSHIKIIQHWKERLPDWLKFLLIRTIYNLQLLSSWFFPKKKIPYDKSKKNIFVLLSTDYSNLGDHALTYAHIKYLNKVYPTANIIEVVVSDTLKCIKVIKENIKDDDLITLKGGGNIGIQYFREELYRRKIISTFKSNKIIIFPQTIYFPDNKIGNKEKEITFNVFKENKNLYVVTRDKESFKQIENVIRERAILTPDIVLSLENYSNNNLSRKGVVTAFRDDVEGVFNDKFKIEIIEKIKNKFNRVIISDTTTDYPINISMREIELHKIWDKFCSAELIITDRLHGMIFAKLTSTPCIVMRTYNHKLTGQYEWLSEYNNIILLDEIDKLEETIDAIIGNYSSTGTITSRFDKLREIL